MKIKRRLREFKRSISNLLYYFKVIWKDRQWDHSYLESLLLAKYKRMYKFRTSSKWCMKYVESDKDNQALRICINILERRRNNWYTDIWYLRAGRYMNFNFEDCGISGFKELKIDYKSPKIHPDYVRENNKLRLTDFVEVRDWEIYCKLIKKYHNRWWD